jgi:phosphoribosyl 1,2-cyclic phosphate phosphodiesterase
MEITLLGTSAANAYPEAFCQCANSEKARLLGGRSLRNRSSALVNDDLLIDLGPDIITASSVHGRPLTDVRFCLQTHAHEDHLYTSHFLSRSPAFGVVGAPRLHFYASAGTWRLAAQRLRTDCAPASFLDQEVAERPNLQIHPIEAPERFTVGDYRVTAFPSNHDPTVEPLLYAIESDGSSIFHGADTATLPEETWQAFHEYGLRFDLVILDHTYSPDESGTDHLSPRELIDHVERMREERFLTPQARALATHLSHPGDPPHPVLSDFAARHGYEVAYDHGVTIAL